MLTKDVALATAADIKALPLPCARSSMLILWDFSLRRPSQKPSQAATYAMGTGSCRQDDVNVGAGSLSFPSIIGALQSSSKTSEKRTCYNSTHIPFKHILSQVSHAKSMKMSQSASQMSALYWTLTGCSLGPKKT